MGGPAHDPRIGMVIASCSGEGGAALSRRNYGETIAHLTILSPLDPTLPDPVWDAQAQPFLRCSSANW